ncbi:hypothetical protein [Comamonas sp. 26]|uniref:hypothetical protein n=1 Tax=Comamonas sp. 26 TaxID=2035201 RepID=UPI0011981D9C|nr:hypothetical protein [Comamonas sp. 26]
MTLAIKLIAEMESDGYTSNIRSIKKSMEGEMSGWISIAVSVFFSASALLITLAKLKEDERERVLQNLGRWSLKTKRILKASFYVIGLLNSVIGLVIVLVLTSSPDVTRKDLGAAALHAFAILLLLGDLIGTQIFNRLDKQAEEIQELKAQLKLWQQTPLHLASVVELETTTPTDSAKNAASPCIESASSYQN